MNLDHFADCVTFARLCTPPTTTFTDWCVDNPIKVLLAASAAGSLFSLAALWAIEGTIFLHRCSYHVGGPAFVQLPAPLGRWASATLDSRPFLWLQRWRWLAVSDGLCAECSARANAIVDRELAEKNL
jgi:hypothetical protein